MRFQPAFDNGEIQCSWNKGRVIIIVTMTTTRIPYSFPQYQNDDDFVGRRDMNVNGQDDLPSHLAQNQDPWNRLHVTSTENAARREVYHTDTRAPRDSLDFVLNTKYDQHTEFMKGKHATLLQPKTLRSATRGRKPTSDTTSVDSAHPVQVATYCKNEVIKTQIEGQHTQSTNAGYSRKPNGGFYMSWDKCLIHCWQFTILDTMCDRVSLLATIHMEHTAIILGMQMRLHVVHCLGDVLYYTTRIHV